MPIKQLKIHHFRNIEFAEFFPSPKFNFIIGDNGSGKTSLLEAIYMLGHGRAFRHQLSSRVIQYDHSQLTIFSEISFKNGHQTIGLSKSRSNENSIRINHDKVSKLGELAKLLPIQLITPEGFDLVNGGPKYRRAFIDWGCFHHYAEFGGLWNDFRKLLKQRNAALRQITSYTQLQPWDKLFVPIAKRISEIRQNYIDQIKDELINTNREFLPEYSIDCHFYPGWNQTTDYNELLIDNFEKDKMLSYTSVGPHKADLKLRSNSYPVEDFFSRGQLKLLMCALRLAQGEFYSHKMDQPCLYLIDDFTSELDELKQNLLSQKLKSISSQVFISSVSQNQIQSMISENDKIFYIKSGIISQ